MSWSTFKTHRVGLSNNPAKYLDITSNDDSTFKIVRGDGLRIMDIDALGRIRDNSILFTGTFSNVAFIDIPNVITSAYDLYEIEVYDIVARIDNSQLLFRGSVDNGATFLTNHYGSRMYGFGGTPYSYSDNGAASITLAGTVSNAGGGKYTLELKPTYSASGTLYPRLSWAGGHFYQASGTEFACSGTGCCAVASSLNAFRLVMSAGNIDAKVIIRGINK